MGRPTVIDDGEIEALLKARDKVALSTGDIAGELDVHRKTAHNRLRHLESEGVVHSDEISQADAWYLANSDPIVTVNNSGRPKKELRGAILNLLESTDHRAMTLGMITENVDGARRTVKDRLDSLVEDDGVVKTDKIGNATAYYIDE